MRLDSCFQSLQTVISSESFAKRAVELIDCKNQSVFFQMPLCNFLDKLELSLPRNFLARATFCASLPAAVFSLPLFTPALCRFAFPSVILLRAKQLKILFFRRECHRGVVSEHRPSLFLAERRGRGGKRSRQRTIGENDEHREFISGNQYFSALTHTHTTARVSVCINRVSEAVVAMPVPCSAPLLSRTVRNAGQRDGDMRNACVCVCV